MAKKNQMKIGGCVSKNRLLSYGGKIRQGMGPVGLFCQDEMGQMTFIIF